MVEWLIPHGTPTLYDPASAEAFAIRGDSIVPLRRVEQAEEQVTTPIGEMRARQA